ncbi:methyltransferase domain-containing protein [Paraglaciecola sp.]|uniref:class I SAM-dependent methyltransferase n=1 Tax=Paraglaciecola sp. TaxID=1920173 RepID=UPI003266895A
MKKCQLTRINYQYCLTDTTTQTILPNVWEKFADNNTIELFVVENILPYLTSMEADLAMLVWFDALTVGGEIDLSVPNTDYFIEMWQQAKWDNSNLLNSESEARTAFAGLWGAQENCNPRDNIYNENFQCVYKSGYNAPRLTLLLERAGFCNLSVISDGDKVKATATKTMDRGERQITTKYDQIRPDHLNRYEFACHQIGKIDEDAKLLDLACGIGYGTLMLANKTGAKVTGVDIEQAAITHAKQHFSNNKTDFICQDAKLLDIESSSKDVVVSFETIEHVDFDQQLLDIFFNVLKPGGRLICSTPNQDVMPYDKHKFAYHIKHYTNSELVKLLTKSGFVDIKLFAQYDPVGGKVVEGQNGSFTIAIAVK